MPKKQLCYLRSSRDTKRTFSCDMKSSVLQLNPSIMWLKMLITEVSETASDREIGRIWMLFSLKVWVSSVSHVWNVMKWWILFSISYKNCLNLEFQNRKIEGYNGLWDRAVQTMECRLLTSQASPDKVPAAMLPVARPIIRASSCPYRFDYILHECVEIPPRYCWYCFLCVTSPLLSVTKQVVLKYE